MGRFLFNDPIASLPIQGGFTPGTFTNATVTVNNQGIITNIINGSGGGANAFNDLTDVTLTSPILNDTIFFDGTNWINIPGIFPSDIGITIQAWNAALDNLSSLNSTVGFLIHTGLNTFDKREIKIVPNSGLSITDGDGVLADPLINFDISNTPLSTAIDPINDFILFYDSSTNSNVHTTIQDVINASAPVTGATNVGAGSDIFKFNNNTVLEFRTLTSSSLGLNITSTTNDVIFSLDSDIETLASLVPTTDAFIVGDSSGNWSVETPALARNSLGLGSMAIENANDFLRLIGGVMSGSIDMASNSIINLLDPINPQDAATKNYVDNNIPIATDPGAGLTRTGTILDIGQNADNSILVNANDIQLNTAFTDTLYFAQTVLMNTTAGSEGAALIGTDTKAGLNNSTTVEDALEFINTELPFAVQRFRLELTGTWNLDVGAPNVIVDTVNDVEIARFQAGADVAIYRDLMLPPDFDSSRPLQFSAAFRKETVTTGQVDISLAFQHQRSPGTFIDDIKSFSNNNTDIVILQWTISGGTFLPLDVVTLRLSRKGTNVTDTHTTGADFFAAYLIQNWWLESK